MNRFITLSLICAGLAHAETTPQEYANCQTTREFVTTLEFLRQDEDFKLKEQNARDLAFKVAEGCTGSAKRFIRIAKALTRSGSNNKDAIETAAKFATAKDAETDTFITVFRRSIAEDSLDLDFESSLKLALSLSKQFAGDQEKVRDDFEKIVNYCSDSNRLGLPLVRCGPFAADIAKSGEKWKDGVSTVFIESYEYLKADNGPALTTKDAISVAERLVKQGPGAYENFKQAYQYAVADSGLKLARDDAIQFARKMATIAEKAETKIEDLKSGPAKR